MIEEAAAHDVRLVFTTVWNLAGERDAAYIRGLVAPYVERGLPVRFVELHADLATRLDRNNGADRLAASPPSATASGLRGTSGNVSGPSP